MKIQKDGDQYMIVNKDFVDLQSSGAVFVTPQELQEVLGDLGKRHEWDEFGYSENNNCSKCGIAKEDSYFCKYPLIKSL